jgi:methionyl-tRNA synthetase
MTYTVVEVHKISCDECDEEETMEVNAEYENVYESEDEFMSDLQRSGWIYSKEHDKHFCPECAKDPEIIAEYDLKKKGDDEEEENA